MGRRCGGLVAAAFIVVVALQTPSVWAQDVMPPAPPAVTSPPTQGQPIVPVPPPTDPRFRNFDYLQTTTGSVLWGRLESQAQGSVLFDILGLDEMNIKVKNIAVLIAHTTTFQVDIKGYPRLIGRVDPADKTGRVVIFAGALRIEVPVAEIIWLRRVERRFFDRLDGSVSSGYSFTSASGIGRFNFAENVQHTTEWTTLVEYYSLAMTLGDETPGADRIDGGVGGSLIFGSRYVTAQFLQYQKIVSSGLDSRWLSITGGGVRFVHTRYADISILSGVTFTHEKPIGGPPGDLQTEIPLMIAGKFGGPDPKFLVTTTATEYASLTVSKRYRTDIRFNASYELLNHKTYGTVTLGSEILYTSDSRPPGGGSRTRDLNVSFTIGYSF